MLRVRRHADYGFVAFNRWFTSRGGVFQTFLICVLLVFLEAFHVLPDPNGFWLLYYLTVYSAITQPALAASAAANEDRLEQLLHKLRQSDELNVALSTKILSLLEASSMLDNFDHPRQDRADARSLRVSGRPGRSLQGPHGPRAARPGPARQVGGRVSAF